MGYDGWKTGAAPATSRSTTWRSTVELHPPCLLIISFYEANHQQTKTDVAPALLCQSKQIQKEGQLQILPRAPRRQLPPYHQEDPETRRPILPGGRTNTQA
jgi:hypothetical protein